MFVDVTRAQISAGDADVAEQRRLTLPSGFWY